LISFFVAYQIQKAQPESTLVASTYRGEIVIFYDETCGRDQVTENGRRIYNIPSNGVLITKFQENTGYLDRKFYLLDAAGVRTEILFFYRRKYEDEAREWKLFHNGNIEDFSRQTVGVFNSGGTPTYAISQKSLHFTIADFKYFERVEQDQIAESERFADLAAKLLLECRTSTVPIAR